MAGNGPSFPRAGIGETLAFARDVVLPTFAKGIFLRRPRILKLAERMDADRRAVRRLTAWRDRWGGEPVYLGLPGRRHLVVLRPDDALEILERAPEPFAPRTLEKRSALAHFEPEASLISTGVERTVRRRLNEDVLSPDLATHPRARALLEGVEEDWTGSSGSEETLTWSGFHARWNRMARRVVLGKGAAADEDLTADLTKLRAAANWAFLHPGRAGLRRRFHERISRHLETAEDGLAPLVRQHAAGKTSAAPEDQVAHYLFAFDAGALATYRALALLASHPAIADDARAETQEKPPAARDLLRACILESLRLWPTTPTILRETAEDTRLAGKTVPARTNILIFAPFFHRDARTLPYAHRFAPEIWLDPGAREGAALVPFSAGPAICPAHRLVPMIGSAVLSRLVARGIPKQREGLRLDAREDLPGTFDPHSLTFAWG